MDFIRGILPALVTPYTADNKINPQALRQLIAICLGKGVNGFYVGGSTGEVFLLSRQERMQLTEIAIDAVDNAVPVIVHVGSISTEVAVKLAKHAEKTGAAAVSSIPPFYYNFSQTEILDYYRDILKAVDIPLIVYNFPAFAGVELNLQNASDLFREEQVLGIKYTSKDLYQLERIKSFDRDFVVLNGHDEVFLGVLALGADGAVGSTFNIIPEYFIKMQELFFAGQMQQAKQIQMKVNGLIAVLMKTGVFPSIKYLLELQGIRVGLCRPPFKAVKEENKNLLRATWESDWVSMDVNM